MDTASLQLFKKHLQEYFGRGSTQQNRNPLRYEEIVRYAKSMYNNTTVTVKCLFSGQV